MSEVSVKRIMEAPWRVKVALNGKAKLIGRFKDMKETDTIEILYPGKSGVPLQIKVNGHEVYNEPIPKTIAKLECVKKEKSDHYKVTLILTKKEKDDWPPPNKWPQNEQVP